MCFCISNPFFLFLSVSLDRGRAQLDSSERELLKEIRELRQKLAARAKEGSSASSQSVHTLSSISQWPQTPSNSGFTESQKHILISSSLEQTDSELDRWANCFQRIFCHPSLHLKVQMQLASNSFHSSSSWKLMFSSKTPVKNRNSLFQFLALFMLHVMCTLLLTSTCNVWVVLSKTSFDCFSLSSV